MKIIMGTIHHRLASSSSDYIDTDQKCIMYYLHKGLKLNLPSLLFKYVRDSVRDTRNNMKHKNYIPLGRLISDVLIESGMMAHLIFINMIEDVTVDMGKPMNAKNMKSVGLIDKVRIKPTLDTSWESLKEQRKIPNRLYLFSKIDPPEVIAHYLQDLESQGIYISGFSVDWLPEQPPNFMKRKRENYEKKKKKMTLKLRDSSTSQKQHVPLSSSAPSKSLIFEAPLSSGSTKILSSLPQPPPIIYPFEPTIFIPILSEPHTLEPLTSKTHHSESNSSLSPLQNSISQLQPFLYLKQFYSMNPYHLPHLLHTMT